MSELKEIKDLLLKIRNRLDQLENKSKEIFHEGLIWLPMHETKMTWQEAMDYAKSINARLPKPSEFLHAYETGFKFEHAWFWSTKHHFHENDSFLFSGKDGLIHSFHKSHTSFIYCVRP